MRPVAAKYSTTQRFGEGATAGVIGNPNAPQDTIEYYVGIYGDYQHEGHAGEDIGCPVGTPIYAPADGTVLYAGWVEDLPGTGPVRGWLLYWNFGGIVTITQHDGWISVIAHQSDNNMVHAGMSVKEGQLIGKSGNTKTRTTTVAPHVHVEALVYMDYRTDVARGIIYGRVDPRRYFGTSGAAITAQSVTAPAPAKQKESEMPVPMRVDSTFKARHRLPKGKPYTLSVADDGRSANFAVGGVGHYVIHNYIRGEGLLPGQRIKAQFFLTKAGKTSGHFEQDIVGTIDGTFDHAVVFNRAIEAGTTLSCLLTSSNTETAYITGFGAEIATWKA
ncbi:metallo-endopeptidase [Arthrobacter phage TripleJ]|uniref:Lysin A, protease M23 domain n=1 Tax=Arthrobacter phage TripleJ TaxID=2599838 RepID=A0A5J6TGU3_9CAUD|nr:metallo-endopeptidase [Arthrobacter phage TripleJ]QFG09568.1 lysin A, protease M23 domain [Arthrobacter phage TripleJ]